MKRIKLSSKAQSAIYRALAIIAFLTFVIFVFVFLK